MKAYPIARIAVLQISLIVISFLVLGVVMKVGGYPHPPNPEVRWNSFTVFLRHHGMWLLLVPIAWAILCDRAQRHSPEWSHSATVISGLLTTAFTCGLFAVAAALFFLSYSTLVKVEKPTPEPKAKISKRFQTVEEQTSPAERSGP
jgi:hypothetical protein